MYANYEVLINALNQNIIDLSEVEIQKIAASETDKETFEKFISS